MIAAAAPGVVRDILKCLADVARSRKTPVRIGKRQAYEIRDMRAFWKWGSLEEDKTSDEKTSGQSDPEKEISSAAADN
ncbi:MAG: hypothetical protein LBQ79_09765 [Deltaproteobacteria bacterium]|nr:hypothetical protein [Deltaproteobacteria bacterium]